MAEGGTARLLRLTKVRNCQFIQALAGWISSATAICAVHRTKPTREWVSENGLFLLADIWSSSYRKYCLGNFWERRGDGVPVSKTAARGPSISSQPVRFPEKVKLSLSDFQSFWKTS